MKYCGQPNTFLSLRMNLFSRDSGSKGRFATFIAHFIFIVIIFILPELVMNMARPNRSSFGFYPGFYFKTLVLLGVFYVNYFIVVDRTLSIGRSRILRFILWNVLLICAGLALDYVSTSIWFPPRFMKHHDMPTMQYFLRWVSYLMRDAVMMILTIGLAVALRLSLKWKDMEQQRKELQAAQRSTELDNLKSQLNPHFLFNTLNTIYALVDIDPEDAKRAVHRLSGLLRYMLYESEMMVTVSEEIGFIEDYIELMRLRMSDRPLDVEIDIAGHENDHMPPLLLVALVENAFKFGSTAEQGLPIKISMKVVDGVFLCSTENSFSEVSDKPAKKASGIGLANLRRRLSLIYGAKASLRTSVSGNLFTTRLSLPL